MLRAALLNRLRLMAALAVMLSAVPLLRAAGPSHPGVVLQAVHVADLGVGGQTHSHSHDDTTDGTSLPFHGHEYTDHSHVTLGLPTPPSSVTGPKGRLVRTRDDCKSRANPPYRLDRPPCSLSSA